MLVNDHYLKLQAGYLFPEIARRVSEFSQQNPDARVIKLGIGDVTEPLPPAIVDAMRRAVEDLGTREGFHGYGPEQGYQWLREKIVANEYAPRGARVEADEVFVSDGSKCDTANILDILATGPGGIDVALVDPVYPVYRDTNVMAGNTGPADESGSYEGLELLPATADNDFVAPLPKQPVDVVYLCYPNNPTGATITRDRLAEWVAWAREHEALLLFDAAYEAYVTDESLPRSIYEIEGAREVAIEFRSFSKKAGFTGVRCAWTVVPHDLVGKASDGERVALHGLWNRRHGTKFNGASYISQRGAEAVYSDAGAEQVASMNAFYLENARRVREAVEGIGLRVYGGRHCPYVWVKVPEGATSWDFFERLLQEAHIVATPGNGFGAAGEGYIRLSAFNSRENVDEATRRLERALS